MNIEAAMFGVMEDSFPLNMDDFQVSGSMQPFTGR